MISNRNISNQIPETRLPTCRTHGRSYTAVQFGSKDDLNLSPKFAEVEKKTVLSRIMDFLLAPFRKIIACIWGNKDEVPTTPQPVQSNSNSKVQVFGANYANRDSLLQSPQEKTTNTDQSRQKNAEQSKWHQDLTNSVQQLKDSARSIIQVKEWAAKKGLKLPPQDAKRLLQGATLIEHYRDTAPSSAVFYAQQDSEKRNLPFSQKRSILTSLRHCINNSKDTLEELLKDTKKIQRANSRFIQQEEWAKAKSEKSIRNSQIAKSAPQYRSNDNAQHYFDRNIVSLENSLEIHQESIFAAKKLEEKHKIAIDALYKSIDPLKRDAHSIDLKLKIVEQTRYIEEARQVMERYNRVVRPSYIDASQDIEHMRELLDQLERGEERYEAERKRYLQSRKRQ